MQFVKNGPDVPERLLQAHEDGQVVFFCGAGISYPASLPDFAGLVKKLYDVLAPIPSAAQKAAIRARQFDTAIGLLEANIINGRETVRHELSNILLVPNLDTPKATATHEALLTLGRNREGQTRLITTNFDRLFEEVIVAKSLTLERFKAPLLPVPKNRWNGLVYLHGLLSPAPTPGGLDQLVVSSGDFGLAYLTERWAARFVSELFRNYTVCFIGYSISDPMIRYMMDALAADRLLGESPHEMFVFGSHTKGKEDKWASEWRAKNVTPILYREHNRHAYLHKTLHAWADTYRDGVRGKERIIVECAMARPSVSTRQDDFVGRVLWALSDPSGLPAKRFAELDPVPSLDWLEPLCEKRFHHADLDRFGVPPKPVVDEKLAFSLTQRPSPYPLAPSMILAGTVINGSRWDKVMQQLARWLMRHLNDPALLLWFVKRGGQLHNDLIGLIEHRLDKLYELERNSKLAELEHIRSNAIDAIPSPLMRTLWKLLLTGRVKSSIRDFNLYRWRDHFKRDGLTATSRLELREMLTPRVSLRKHVSWLVEDEQPHETERIKDLVEWEIVLSVNYVHSGLSNLSGNERWTTTLPELLSDFSALLRDTLDLMRELGGAEDKSDLSYRYQPSIDEHPQNRYLHDWTALIDLVRDAWLATAERSPDRAALVAETWWLTPYPLFKRLAFFAATQSNTIPHRHVLDWLLADDQWWLWSVEAEREALRLLVALAPQLDGSMYGKLEQAILMGPPRVMFKDDIEPEYWNQIVNRKIWLRLAKMAEAGAVLSTAGRERLDALSTQYPEWELATDQCDEFPFWMGDGSNRRKFVTTPQRRRPLIEWLRQYSDTDYRQDDDWRQRCHNSFPTTACALCALAKEDFWPTDRWRIALDVWSEGKLLDRSWRYLAQVLIDAPNDLLQSADHSISWWLQAVTKVFQEHEDIFFKLVDRILCLYYKNEQDTNEPVRQAINHPIGRVTQALLTWWFREELDDGQGLPTELQGRFTQLCNTTIDKFRYGRTILASRVIELYRVDPEWARQNLLPLFDWGNSEVDALSAWEGFLWSFRLYRPLMADLKDPFLDAACHYADLKEFGSQYAALLTIAALDRGDTFSFRELVKATGSLPSEGLEEVSSSLVRTLEGAGDQKVEYWENRISPYMDRIWPKQAVVITPTIAENLAKLCIAAGDRFPAAFKQLRKWVHKLEDTHFISTQLHESGLCLKFPETALEFLYLVHSDHVQWLGSDVTECLQEIRRAMPSLADDQKFLRLIDFLRERGMQWP